VPHAPRHVLSALAGALLALAAVAPAAGATTVVVMESPHAGRAPEAAVRALGGRVERRLAVVDGFSAQLDRRAAARLRHERGVRAVVADRRYGLSSTATDPATSSVVLDDLRHAIGADLVGGGGAGVDVALVDSGVTPVGPLADPGRIVAGPDLSSEATDADLHGLDGFGHGTHLAGIISAVAPEARVVSVKIAAHDGSTTLVRVLAGLDWVVRNAHRDGLNIRVVNLAFGAPVDGSYQSDPLAFAVEQAWRHGVAVVAAAGNGGARSGGLDSPAYDPYVIAAGAEDSTTGAVADFSSAGTAERTPDVVAPGVSIVSLRTPDSFLDLAYPSARVGDTGFRGSGTSQAAAVVSGAVALLVAQRPALTPDHAKALLAVGAHPLAGAPPILEGAGAIDVAASDALPAPSVVQRYAPAHGAGPFRGRGALGPQLQPNSVRFSSVRFSSVRFSSVRFSSVRFSSVRFSGVQWPGG